MTRQQRFLSNAYEKVTEVKNTEEKSVQERYGSYCHKLPALIRACGLCQALAYVQERADPRGSDQKKAMALILDHVAHTLGVQSDQLIERVRKAGMVEYMHMTREVLSAWVYYKRFATSILGVESGESADGR